MMVKTPRFMNLNPLANINTNEVRKKKETETETETETTECYMRKHHSSNIHANGIEKKKQSEKNVFVMNGKKGRSVIRDNADTRYHKQNTIHE